MSDATRHQCAVADFTEGGEIHIKNHAGEHLVLSLGPAQIINLKRGMDCYVAKYEAEEIRAKQTNEPA